MWQPREKDGQKFVYKSKSVGNVHKVDRCCLRKTRMDRERNAETSQERDLHLSPLIEE